MPLQEILVALTLKSNLIEMTVSNKPNSRYQQAVQMNIANSCINHNK